MTSPIILHKADDVFSIVSAAEYRALPKFTAVISGDKLPIVFTTSPINKSSSALDPFLPKFVDLMTT